MIRSKKKINVLIEKYFEGLTSLKEEQTLRNYFGGENVSEELKIYGPMFRYFSSEREAKRRFSLLPFPERVWKKGLWAAAACLLLLIGLRPAFNTHKTSIETSLAYIDGKKYTDIERIQSEALKALENISESNNAVFSTQVEALDLFFDNK